MGTIARLRLLLRAIMALRSTRCSLRSTQKTVPDRRSATRPSGDRRGKGDRAHRPCGLLPRQPLRFVRRAGTSQNADYFEAPRRVAGSLAVIALWATRILQRCGWFIAPQVSRYFYSKIITAFWTATMLLDGSACTQIEAYDAGFRY
jgi:hypothetical protein